MTGPNGFALSAPGHLRMSAPVCGWIRSTWRWKRPARGYGIALGRTPLVDAEIKSGQLVRLIDQSVPSGWCYWLVTMDADFQSQDVKTFRQWLLDELAEAQPGSKQKAAAENRLTLIRGNARRRVE